ncbi:MAG: hypothetical protein VB092_07420 [Oscillospiraceae bacterium]|nr:hypothetical protein [Oscillospiraceae bacterium]
MKMQLRIIAALLALILAFIAAGCTAEDSAEAEFKKITPPTSSSITEEDREPEAPPTEEKETDSVPPEIPQDKATLEDTETLLNERSETEQPSSYTPPSQQPSYTPPVQQTPPAEVVTPPAPPAPPAPPSDPAPPNLVHEGVLNEVRKLQVQVGHSHGEN